MAAFRHALRHNRILGNWLFEIAAGGNESRCRQTVANDKRGSLHVQYFFFFFTKALTIVMAGNFPTFRIKQNRKV